MKERIKFGFSVVLVWVIGMALPFGVYAQTFVTPGPNTNIVGVTPKLEHVPDFQLKQQQEPSCIVRPGNESYIMCAYNDMRASDIPAVQGDGWMGVSMTNDEADTWFSRLAPGYLGHPDSIGMGFAADPSLVAIPGNSPGLAVLNYIAGHRGTSNSVLAIQRWVEFPQEDRDFWKPESPVRIVTTSDIEGGFIDKPSFFYLIDAPAQQGEFTQHIVVEGETSPISITTPTGTLVVVYAVFPDGSDGSKLMLRRSIDNGETWSAAIQLADGKTQINGSSVTAFGNKIAVVYRQAGGTVPGYLCDPNDDRYDSHLCGDDDHHKKNYDHKNKHHYCDDQSNEGCLEVIPDAVVAKVCTNNTELVCTTSDEIFEICPFDQPASGATFRTSTFPWLTYDGSRLWAFSASRNPGGSCDPVPDAPGQFYGKPRIVAMSSVNGMDWVGADGNTSEPIVIAPRGAGFQVMPVAFGTKGRVDLAWTDTYREEVQDVPLPSGNPDIYINDYVSGSALVRRKADVWMTRLQASCGTSATAGCTPTIQDPVRISSYDTVMESLEAQIANEIEADLKNLRTHVSGTMAFTGDYKALATAPFRQLANGKWIPNSVQGGSAGPELPGFTDSQNVFIAWGDNRDVDGELVNERLVYTPPVNSDANPGGAVVKASEIAPENVVKRQSSMLALDTPDHEDGVLAGEDLSTCVVGGNEYTRSRDVNVYGSLVRDRASLVAPTPVKPLGSIQRMYPLEITNIDREVGADYCLQIANQPSDLGSTTGLASFYQLPAIAPFYETDVVGLLDVFVPAGSSASRAVFLTTSETSTVITVNAYEGACPATSGETFGTLVNSVRVGNGPLRDPEFCSSGFCDSVLVNETHDINLASPALQAPALQAPALQAPALQAPALQAPALQAPALQAPTFAAPALQAPALQAPALQAPALQAPALQAPALQAPALQAPALQAPALQAPALQAALPADIVYQDISYVVNSGANVTTTYSADIRINGLDLDSASVQMIAWTPNVYTSTEDCLAVPAANQQIIAYRDLDAPSLQAVSLPQTFSPSNQNPYAGELSFTGSPDKDIVVTIRIWATGPAKLQLKTLEDELNDCRQDPMCDADSGEFGAARLISFGASAHQCSTVDAVINTTTANQPDCLNNGNEKIRPDLAPPIITVPADFSVEADRPEGAVVTYAASASDNLDPSPIFSCTPPSGSTIALSSGTSITCYAEDFRGNSTFKTFMVSVVDTTAPTLPSLADISAEATSASGAVVSFATPAANDAVDTSPAVSCLPDSGSAFVLGSTTVTCTASDASGNDSSQSFVVAVADTTAPALNLPSSITVEPREPGDPQAGTFDLDASGNVTVEANLPPPDGAKISFSATATDAVADAANVSVSCSPQSGDVFPFGSNTVSCSASDGINTSPISSFMVTIEDTLDPVFNVDDNAVFTFTATEPRGAEVDLAGSGAVVATDRGATILPECSATSAALGITKLLPEYLEAGEWQVTCSVDGVTATTISVTVTVDIIDTAAPLLTIPAATLSVNADADTGKAIVDFLALNAFGPGLTISASDDVDTDVEISCTPSSPSEFNVGDTTVTCTASDDGPNASGQPNTTTGSFVLTVVDVTPPSIVTLPVPVGGNLLQEATSAAGAVVTYTVQSTDSADLTPVIACGPIDSGSVFPIGDTIVTCTATDFSGNFSTGAFTVTIKDTTAPVITVPVDVTVEASAAPNSVVSIGDATATDDVGPISITNDAPADFPLGTTTVTWTATDNYGNASSGTQSVTVQDTTAPVLTVPDDIAMASNMAVGVPVSFTVSATDLFPVTTTCTDQDGLVVQSGDVFPIGETTVTCTAKDANDNTASDSFLVDIEQSFGIRLIVPKGLLQAGSTNPIDWQYLDPTSGDVIESGFLEPVVSWKGPYEINDSECTGATDDSGSGDDAGYSDKRYSESSQTWQFSWKTPDMPGYFLLIISPPGIGDPEATACVRLK